MNRFLIACVTVWLAFTSSLAAATQVPAGAATDQKIYVDEEELRQPPKNDPNAEFERELQETQEAWRVADNQATALSETESACSASIDEAFKLAEARASDMLDVKSRSLNQQLDFFGKRYTSASTLSGTFDPLIATMRRQQEGLGAELTDLERRMVSLRGNETAAARESLRQIADQKKQQTVSLREAVLELEQAKGELQQERLIAARARQVLVSALQAVAAEADLWDAYYRHRRSTVNLRCTSSMPIRVNQPIRPPRPGER